MTSDLTPSGSDMPDLPDLPDIPDDLSGLFELMQQGTPTTDTTTDTTADTTDTTGDPAWQNPEPGRAYVSIAAATRETLRTFMLQFHQTIGVYGLPFAVNPDPAGCAMCSEALHVLQTPDGAFEASLPTHVLTDLDGQTRRLFDREFTGYRIHPSECPHIFVLSVPDTLFLLLDPICEQVTVHDDTSLGRWLGEPENLTPVLTVDDISRAQCAAVGLDADHALTRAGIVTDVRYVTDMQIPATPDALALPTEVPTATAYLGETDGDLIWTTEHPVRLRGATRNTFYSSSDYNEAERTTLTETGPRLTFAHTRNLHDPDACTLRIEATHDPHMTRRTRYLDGDTATFGPWWRPTGDDKFTVELDATSPTPASVLDEPVDLPARLTLTVGGDATGRVEDRALKANPWTGERYWSLTLVVTETPHDGHYLRILCPYTDGQQIRRGTHVTLTALTLTARLVP